MSTWIERLSLATSQWVEDLTTIIESRREDETPEASFKDSEEARAMRVEYGYSLLAKDAEIEELQGQLRTVTHRLQLARDAYQALYDALYEAQ